MKRVISLFLVLVLLLGSVVNVFAENVNITGSRMEQMEKEINFEIEIAFSSSRYIPMKNRDTRSDGSVVRNNNKIIFNYFSAITFKTSNSIVVTYL